VGHTFFGDLFLRDTESGEYAVLTSSTLELVVTGEVEASSFEEHTLANPAVVHELLRPGDAAAIARRVGAPAPGEALFPVPFPAIGGAGTLESFRRGGLREHLAIVAQALDGPD
jgi:hypothetical protein